MCSVWTIHDVHGVADNKDVLFMFLYQQVSLWSSSIHFISDIQKAMACDWGGFVVTCPCWHLPHLASTKWIFQQMTFESLSLISFNFIFSFQRYVSYSELWITQIFSPDERSVALSRQRFIAGYVSSSSWTDYMISDHLKHSVFFLI